MERELSIKKLEISDLKYKLQELTSDLKLHEFKREQELKLKQ